MTTSNYSNQHIAVYLNSNVFLLKLRLFSWISNQFTLEIYSLYLWLCYKRAQLWAGTALIKRKWRTRRPTLKEFHSSLALHIHNFALSSARKDRNKNTAK